MITSFNIQNFRCFQDFTIQPLERVNLIVGKNDVGKTALLEALWLHFGYYNPALTLSIDNFRGIEKFQASELLWDLFNDFDPSKLVKLSSKDEDGRPRVLRIEINEKHQKTVGLNKARQRGSSQTSANKPTGWVPTSTGESEIHLSYNDGEGPRKDSRAYIEEDKIKIEQAKGVRRIESVFMPSRRHDTNEERADRLSRYLKTHQPDQLIRTLKVLEDRLENLVILFVGGDPIIHAQMKGNNRLIPFPLMGDGIGRLLSIALAITYANGGAVLIDEIENGLHYSVMSGIGQAIAELANECNVQVFATSHSEECIMSMREGIINSSSPEKSGRLFRLERKDGDIKMISYSLDELEVAERHGIEVR
jgi:AAA15 family ATPase/GTPase